MKRSFYKGFTLLELGVSVFIIMIMSAMLLVNYPDSAVRLSLINASHTLALLVREAQVRGSAVDSQGGAFAGYGMFIDIATPTQAVLFSDAVTSVVKNGINISNGKYDFSPINEAKSITKFPAGYTIHRLCTGNIGAFVCTNVNTLTVSFVRPDPEPHFFKNNTLVTDIGVCIEMVSNKAPAFGHTRTVQVFNTGLITTTNGACN